MFVLILKICCVLTKMERNCKIVNYSLTQEAHVRFCLPQRGIPEWHCSHRVDRPVLLLCGSTFFSLHFGLHRLYLYEGLQYNPQTFCKQSTLRIDRNPRTLLTGKRGGQGVVPPQPSIRRNVVHHWARAQNLVWKCRMVAILPAVGHVDFRDVKEDTSCGILITNEKLACYPKVHEPT